MDHWRSVLPADRFTEVEYETLIADREAETRRLIAFCGLDWDDACLAPERNSRVVKTPSLWQVRQPVYNSSVERWRRYEPWLGELRELLPAAEAGGVLSYIGRRAPASYFTDAGDLKSAFRRWLRRTSPAYRSHCRGRG